MLLDPGEDGHYGQDDTQDQVEGDEKLMQLALSSMCTSVVNEEKHNGRHCPSIHEPVDVRSAPQPTLAVCLLATCAQG